MCKNARVIAVAAFVALSLGSGMAIAESKVKIGLNVPLTGFAAADGKSALTAAQLAVEQANSTGGINGKKIELVVYDDQAKPNVAVAVATKLIEKDKVKIAISGSYSGPTKAAAGLFQEAGIPYISAYAVHPDITRSGDYVFRTVLVGEVQARAAAKLIGKSLGKKRVVLTVLKNDYGKSLARGFKQAAAGFGITIVKEYEYSIKERQFGPIVSSIKRDNADAIFDTGYWFVSAALVSQLRSGGVKAVIVGQEGYDSEKFIEIAKSAAEGVMITTALDRDSKEQIVRNFIKAFKTKAGYQADMVGASAHTAVTIAVAAMRKVGSDNSKLIRDAIAKGVVQTVAGNLSFNSLGEVRKVVQIQIVRNGSWRHHSVIDDQNLLKPPSK